MRPYQPGNSTSSGTPVQQPQSSTEFQRNYDRRRNGNSGPLMPGEAKYDYNPRSVSTAYENRWNPQPVMGSYGAETFQSIPVNGSPQRVRSTYWQYTSVSMGDAENLFYQQPPWAVAAFQDAANEYNRVNQYNTSAGAMFKRMLAESKMLASQGIFRSPVEILYDKVDAGVLNMSGPGSDGTGSSSSGGSTYYGGGGYGGGGYGGGGGGASVGTVNLSNPEDARAVINNLALQMIGRTVTDREFKTYYKELNKAEMANPATVRMDVDKKGNPVQVVEAGIGAEGRTAAMQESLRGNESYNEFTLGSEAVNLMSRYLQERGIFRG